MPTCDLKKESLDLAPGTTSKTIKEYPGLRVADWGKKEIYTPYTARHKMPKKIHDTDWIPMITAAFILGISKQALSDRIKRQTLRFKAGRSSSYSYNDDVKMVRLIDCRKKKKAGRPKGSKNKTIIIDEKWTGKAKKNEFTKFLQGKGQGINKNQITRTLLVPT